MTEPTASGVFAPVITPFAADLSVDKKRLAGFCRWLVGEGAGLAVFGTNSEANSLGVEEKAELLPFLIEEGIPASRLMPGTGTCALPDTVRLSRAAALAGALGVLMLPPFYYKAVSEDGLFASFAEVIERVGDRRLRVFLYHIPQVSGVPITPTLIERLARAYPDSIAGVKDSSGDFAHTRGLIERFPSLRIFCGSDTFLLETRRHGGAGCISATANVNARAIVDLDERWEQSAAPALQAGLTAVRRALDAYPMIAALKSLAAHHGRCESFALVRPPLMRLARDDAAKLASVLDALGFSMTGLGEFLDGKG